VEEEERGQYQDGLKEILLCPEAERPLLPRLVSVVLLLVFEGVNQRRVPLPVTSGAFHNHHATLANGAGGKTGRQRCACGLWLGTFSFQICCLRKLGGKGMLRTARTKGSYLGQLRRAPFWPSATVEILKSVLVRYNGILMPATQRTSQHFGCFPAEIQPPASGRIFLSTPWRGLAV
jgi:hypothetical protein